MLILTLPRSSYSLINDSIACLVKSRSNGRILPEPSTINVRLVTISAISISIDSISETGTSSTILINKLAEAVVPFVATVV